MKRRRERIKERMSRLIQASVQFKLYEGHKSGLVPAFNCNLILKMFEWKYAKRLEFILLSDECSCNALAHVQSLKHEPSFHELLTAGCFLRTPHAEPRLKRCTAVTEVALVMKVHILVFSTPLMLVLADHKHPF